MNLACRCLWFLAVFFAATPIFAGTVYVPLVTDVDLDGNRLGTEIRVLNTSTTDFRSFRYFVIPEGTNGTERPDGEVGQAVQLAPRASFQLRDLVAEGESAMVEISADEEIHISSRLIADDVSGAPLLGHEMPVVSSDNLMLATGSAVLQGWARTGADLRTDFHLLVLSEQAATCSASVFAADGGALASGATFSQQPTSLKTFSDVLSLLQVVEQDEISLVLSCDQPFYPFSVTYSRLTAEVLLVFPSASGRSALMPPGDREEPIPGAVVFERPGVFHRPTVGNESRRFDIPFPGNPTFSRILLEMDFTHGGWAPDSSDNHGIFWLNRGDRWRSNLFGYFNVFGPGINQVKLATNVNLAAGEVQAKSVSAFLTPGANYSVRFEYNTITDTYRSTISRDGQVVATVQDVPTANRIRTVDENWFVAFGHNLGAAGTETPTYGWSYSNLRVQWIP